MDDPIRGSDRRSTGIALAVAAASGALWFLASPKLDLWLLAWLAPAPLCWLIDRAPTRRRARRYVWLAGTVTSAGGFYWIAGLLSRHSSFPWPLAALAVLVLAAYQGLIFWLFALVARRIREISADRLGRPLPFALVAPVVFAAAETVWPLIFPYNLAISQAWQPTVIQIAELTGPVGVTALLFAIGGGLYDLAGDRRVRPAAAAAAVAIAVLIYGHVRIGQIDDRRAAAPPLRVGLVQANIPYDGPLAASELAIKRRLAGMQAASAHLERELGAQLIVWPEASLPFALRRDSLPAPAEPLIRHDWIGDDEVAPTPTFTAPAIVGALTLPDDSDEPPYNSALLVVGDDVIARYDKNFLVMFSESIPLADTFPSLEEIMPTGTGHFSPGRELVTFDLGIDGVSYRLAPMICFEDTLPAYSVGIADQRPHLLVNLTNDTWFGDTAEPWQHLALSVFRAVELRTDLVRAVNSGVTSFVDATGQVVYRGDVIDPAAQPTEPSAVLVEARLVEGGRGLFARVGNWLGWLCALLALAGWQLWPRLRRRKG